ncbi:OpgC domain-containing protein [Pseudomonas syringae]|nr:OpgC domain-containing protein [Pseudomonas syringae]MBD8789411.1 OpgC domain-containing protein [Pseudomonas syringae]MBD8800165.1 OpgC domain-containing protein [Pseudomonas syringae]MBD8810839.1 OpgC domain-containing protein [Pseudomonas syringae]
MINGRDYRIDFFRGLALIFIFWDHVPDNPLAQSTVRNFGFSDAAEIFVFLAGYASILAYGRISRRDGWLVASIRILRRTWVLYVVHIFLLTLLMGIVFVANNHVETRDMIQQMGLEHFVGNPQQALADELLLRFKPNLTDPLPLYILLLLALPLILPLMLRKVELAVALSVALYMMVPLYGWNLRSYEGGGVWYFNPVAWQLVFVLGGACALYTERPRTADTCSLSQQPVFALAALYVLIAGVLTFSEKWPPLHTALVASLHLEALYPISKTDLAPVRLLHFVALVYVTARLLPVHARWLDNWPARQTCLMGRYSLEIFCLGVLLAPLADAANALAGDTWPMQVTTALAGLGLMMLMANGLELNKRLGASKVTVETPGLRTASH